MKQETPLETKMSYIVGLDVGGTFTDCVVVDQHGELVTDKAFTTPDNTALGMLQAIENAGKSLGKPLVELLQHTGTLALGTTTLTNLLIRRGGAKVGLLTTRGHEDATLIGRVMSKTDGLPEEEKLDILAWDKPVPLVPKTLIKGVTERVDYKGAVVVPLAGDEVEQAADELTEAGVEAIAVCFLWSFMSPDHEQQAKEIIARKFPDLFIALSSNVAPVIGEYERALSTIMNAYLGPVAVRENRAMRDSFAAVGFSRPFLVMQSNGGVVWDEELPIRPVNLLASGPVGGVNQAAAVGKHLGYSNVIATDMGGTSFDVGLVVDGDPRLVNTALYDRFRLHVPVIEVMSIGAGGGSIAWVDSLTHTLHVGPYSAGSEPGPVCYERGGKEPTVTDADLILNRISADNFFGGRRKLNRASSLQAMEETIAGPLGYDPVAAAKGIIDIADARMADLIHKLTVERGFDPRDFVIFSYGGAGPTHVGAYGREIGVRFALISPYASVFSALGIASSDIVHHYSKSEPMQPPLQCARIEDIFRDLEEKALEDLDKMDLRGGSYAMSRFINMRFRYQVHEIQVPIDWALSSPKDLDRLIDRFLGLYERTFGRGTALKEAGVEILTFHLACTLTTTGAVLKRFSPGSGASEEALTGSRSVYWDTSFVETPVFDQLRLVPGMQIPGPAVIEARNTTALIHPGQQAWVDAYLNIIIEL